MRYSYWLMILVFSSCVATKQEYKVFSTRMKTMPPDGKEFIIEVTEKAVSSGIVNTNPLVIVDGVTLDNEDTNSKQYSLLYKEDIEKVDALDEKKSVIIYGDKGKNGLILVSRKSKYKRYLNYYLKRNN